MMTTLPSLIVLSTLLSKIFAFVPNTPQKMCAGGYKEGDRVDRGRYWYVCQYGQLMPKGCFSNDYRRLNVYESYQSDGYAISCVFDENGYLGFAYKACVHNGREYMPNDWWLENNTQWSSCKREGESLRTEISGCIHNNQRIKIGETVEQNNFVYQCRRYANDTCSMTAVGCIHQGVRYNVGDSIEQDKYWYACTVEDGQIMKKCVGCMYAQKRLQDGDRYTNNDAVFECTIRRGDDPDHRLVGCMDIDNGTIIERRLGCQWVRGKQPYQYVMQCVRDPEHRGVFKKAVHCFYGIGSGGYEVKPGCYKTVDRTLLVACLAEGKNDIRMEIYTADQEDYVKSSTGLQSC